MRSVGVLTFVAGLALVAVALVARIPPSETGIVVPILVGYHAVFLGGLVLGLARPHEERVPILREHRYLAIAFAVWSTIGVVAVAAFWPTMRLIASGIGRLPIPIRDALGDAISWIIAFGALVGPGFGALVSLAFVGRAMVGWIARRVGPASP